MSNQSTVILRLTESDQSPRKSLLQLMQDQKDLGPAILNDSRFNPLLTPFELVWSFGINATVPVVNLVSQNGRQIFGATGNVGIIYDYCKKEMNFLRGHHGTITTSSIDKRGRWIATCESDTDNLVVIWDSITRKSVLSIFNNPNPPARITHVELSPNAKLLIVCGINHEDEKICIDFWLWTYGRDIPDRTHVLDTSYGSTKTVKFHPVLDKNLVLVFEKAVMFLVFDYLEGDLTTYPIVPRHPNDGVYTDATYAAKSHECYVGTNKGSIVVFGCRLFVQSSSDKFNNEKQRIKSVKVSPTAITTVTTSRTFIIVGTAHGKILFFNAELLLLYWLSTKTNYAISSISFNLKNKKYKIVDENPDENKRVLSLSQASLIEDCEDRTEEYELLFRNNAPTDATLTRKLFTPKDFLLSTAEGMVYLVNPIKSSFIPLFNPADSNVAAIDIHSQLSYLLIMYEKGRIILYDYATHEDKTSTIIKLNSMEKITAGKYSKKCHHLVCGSSQGRIWFLHPVLLTNVMSLPDIEAFNVGTHSIINFAFSETCRLMSYYDTNLSVFAFVFVPKTNEWTFKGKIRAHYKKISFISFFTQRKLENILYTIGQDRYIVKYNDFSLEDDEISIDSRERMEQIDIPLYCLQYPKKQKHYGYLLIADNKHKFKLLNDKNNMCVAVFLGPAFNCFYQDPVSKMKFIPNSDYKYIVFMNKRHIGIQKMPIDGNPYRFVGGVASSHELGDFKLGSKGRYIFTFAKNDNAVFMWKIHTKSVELMHKLGGEELVPYYCLIEGGKNGPLFKEIQDLFYYIEIIQGQEYSHLPRHITNYINLAEIPDLVRACGYFPTEFEIENIMTHARYRDYDEKGIVYDTITFCDFIKLFLNHKPVYGYSLAQVEQSVDTLTTFSEASGGGEIDRDDFIEAMSTFGEAMNPEQLYRCMATILQYDVPHDDHNIDFSFVPSSIDYDVFLNDFFGIDLEAMGTGENNSNEDVQREFYY